MMRIRHVMTQSERSYTSADLAHVYDVERREGIIYRRKYQDNTFHLKNGAKKSAIEAVYEMRADGKCIACREC